MGQLVAVGAIVNSLVRMLTIILEMNLRGRCAISVRFGFDGFGAFARVIQLEYLEQLHAIEMREMAG